MGKWNCSYLTLRVPDGGFVVSALVPTAEVFSALAADSVAGPLVAAEFDFFDAEAFAAWLPSQSLVNERLVLLAPALLQRELQAQAVLIGTAILAKAVQSGYDSLTEKERVALDAMQAQRSAFEEATKDVYDP